MSQVQGGVVSQGSIQRELQAGINTIIGQKYDEWPKEYSRILDEYSSKKAYEEDVIRASTGLASVKAEGASLEYDDSREVGLQRYTHVNYAKGIVITEEAMDDNLYMNEGTNAAEALARSMMQTKEHVAADLFNNGYVTTTFTCWDSLSLFNTAHVLGKGGTYSNVLSVAADLSEASLEDALVAIAGFTDDAGLKIKAMGQTLFVPRQLMYIAERILRSTLQNDTAENAINAIRSTNALPGGYEVNHYFSDANNWVVRTDVPNGGKIFNRSSKRGSDNDFGTSNYRHKASERFSVGCTDPRGYFGSGAVA